MINITVYRFLRLILMYCLLIHPLNCCASNGLDEEEKWAMMIPKKAFPESSKIMIPKIDIKELNVTFQNSLISLQETPLTIVRKFSFLTRTQRKIPQLNLTFQHNDFNWLTSNYQDNYAAHLFKIYQDNQTPRLFIMGVECLNYVCGQKLIPSCAEYTRFRRYLLKSCYSLGNMMHYLHKIGIQERKSGKYLKFNEIKCLFAYTYEEIFSYIKLYSVKRKISDTSKIMNIQKAMCLYQAPVIVALSLSNDFNEASCKVLILYHFDDEDHIFLAKGILDSNKVIEIPYMAIQLLALEAWVGYNSRNLTAKVFSSVNLI